MTFNIPFVQSKRELIDVSTKMLGASRMVNAEDATLENGPDGLYGVCVNRSSRVLPGAVIDGGRTKEQSVQIGVGRAFVRVDRGPDFNLLVDLLLNGVQGSIRDDFGPRPSAALSHPEHCRFANRSATRVQLLPRNSLIDAVAGKRITYKQVTA
jgi:hypothetical protein